MKTQCETDLQHAIAKGNAAQALACALILRRELKPDEFVDLSVNALFNQKKLNFFREFVKNKRFNFSPQHKELIRLRVISAGSNQTISNYYSVFEKAQPSQDDLLVLTSAQAKNEARQKLEQYKKSIQNTENTEPPNYQTYTALGKDLITP